MRRHKARYYGECECGHSGPLGLEDHGIGPYEYWGDRGFHHDWVVICPKCEEPVTDYEEDHDE
jgi:hypothetical protein